MLSGKIIFKTLFLKLYTVFNSQLKYSIVYYGKEKLISFTLMLRAEPELFHLRDYTSRILVVRPALITPGKCSVLKMEHF